MLGSETIFVDTHVQGQKLVNVKTYYLLLSLKWLLHHHTLIYLGSIHALSTHSPEKKITIIVIHEI